MADLVVNLIFVGDGFVPSFDNLDAVAADLFGEAVAAGDAEGLFGVDLGQPFVAGEADQMFGFGGVEVEHVVAVEGAHAEDRLPQFVVEAEFLTTGGADDVLRPVTLCDRGAGLRVGQGADDHRPGRDRS